MMKAETAFGQFGRVRSAFGQSGRPENEVVAGRRRHVALAIAVQSSALKVRLEQKAVARPHRFPIR